MKRTLFWVASALMVIGALYCGLGILQAESLYTGERAVANLRLWGSLMLAALIIAVILGIVAFRLAKRGRGASIF